MFLTFMSVLADVHACVWSCVPVIGMQRRTLVSQSNMTIILVALVSQSWGSVVNEKKIR